MRSSCGNARSTWTDRTNGIPATASATRWGLTESRLPAPAAVVARLRIASRVAPVAPTTVTRSIANIGDERSPAYAASSAAAPTAISAARRRRAGTVRATRPGSPRTGPILRLTLRNRDLAEQLHLVLQLDTESLARTPPRLGHQCHHVGRGGAAVVLDEVGVHGRDAGATDPEALQPARLEQLAAGALAGRVLEH